MKYYLIAGEASGDLHGSNLIKGLKKADTESDFRYFGGDLMTSQGGTLVKHYREMAFMGVVDVIKNIRTVGRNLDMCKNDLIHYAPDVLILIDFAGFNLRMAKFAKEHNIKVFYYIAPKVWAWNEKRIKKIKKYVDQLFVILPFEVEYFKKHGIESYFEGNPLVDSIDEKVSNIPEKEIFLSQNNLDHKPIIALLAGSRKHEIDLLLPDMIMAIHGFDEYQFVIAGAPSISTTYYQKYLAGTQIKLVQNKTYDLLKHSVAAVVTSGTATLETALMNVPQVVVYKAISIQYYIGKRLLAIPYFSLVNLIMGGEVVKELLQLKLPERIHQELKKILFDKIYRDSMLTNYAILMELTGKVGVSQRLAEKIVSILKNTPS